MSAPLCLTYLAGPIHGRTDEECRDWRAQAALGLCGVIADPMARDYRGREVENVTAIVEGDVNEIRCCSAVLANVSALSVGTLMELVYAKQAGCFVAVVWPHDRAPSPWLTYHASVVVSSVLEGVQAVNTYHRRGRRAP